VSKNLYCSQRNLNYPFIETYPNPPNVVLVQELTDDLTHYLGRRTLLQHGIHCHINMVGVCQKYMQKLKLDRHY